MVHGAFQELSMRFRVSSFKKQVSSFEFQELCEDSLVKPSHSKG